MSEEQFEKLQKQRGEAPEQKTMDLAQALWQRYDEALAIDPGKQTGAAWTDGDRIRTWTTSFWSIYEAVTQVQSYEDLQFDTGRTAILLEAPYLSAVGSRANNKTAIAYSSGRVAREAELMMKGLSQADFHVEEVDPHTYGAKWDSQTAHQFAGAWTGDDNEHVRDAIRLLVYYNFI